MMLCRACLCHALALNGVWDVVCALAMIVRLHTNDEAKGFVSGVFLSHWALWSEESHRSNVAQRALFACLVLQWGCIRLITASHYDVCQRWAAMSTYGLEALGFVACAHIGHMRAWRAVGAACLCIPFLVLLIIMH